MKEIATKFQNKNVNEIGGQVKKEISFFKTPERVEYNNNGGCLLGLYSPHSYT